MSGAHQTFAPVLVIEDDADTRMMLNDLLQSEGYAPILATTGEDGIELLENEPIGVVVLDIRLPGMDGYTVCEQIRNTSGHDVPILMLTANQDQGGAAKGFLRGADDYLRKPFEPDELIQRINVLRRQRQREHALITDNEAMRQTLEQLQQKLGQATSLSGAETAMRREYVHTVATHLRALCGVIETEFRRNSNPEVREAVQRILSRARGVALVYETSDLLQEEPADFDAITRTIGLAIKQIYSPRSRIPVRVDGEPLLLPLELAAPLAMVFNELVTNCFKHALPKQRFGAVEVSYGQVDDQLELRVSDDGVGMPDSLPAGRGVPTVQQLAAHLRGSVTWSAAPDGGTIVTVRCPLEQSSGPEG